jgi:hypothetical protein
MVVESGRGERASASLTQRSPRFVMINRTPRESGPNHSTKRMRNGYLRGALSRTPTARQVDVLAAYVAAGGSVPDAAARVGIRPSTAKRHPADLRTRSGPHDRAADLPRAGGGMAVRAESGAWVNASG